MVLQALAAGLAILQAEAGLVEEEAVVSMEVAVDLAEAEAAFTEVVVEEAVVSTAAEAGADK